jgi:hypothetical protein
MFKICSHCQKELPLDAFHNDKRKPDGKYSVCRLCRTILKKQVYKQHASKYKGWSKTRSNYVKNKRKTDLNFAARERLRHKLRTSIRNKRFSKNTKLLFGYTWEQLKDHLERLFKPDMNWNNYGIVWCIDHIKPCKVFDLTVKEQILECFSLINIQPLYIKDNLKKNSFHDGYNNRSNEVIKEFLP